MVSKDHSSGRPVQAVQTSCDILDNLRNKGPRHIRDIDKDIAVSKAAIHGHLSTLRSNGFVVKNGKKYQLSLKFLNYGEYTKKSIDMYEIANEEVERLASETKEVAQCMVLEDDHGVYICKSVDDSSIQTRSSVGDQAYLHCTALGKAILSEIPEDRAKEIVERRGLPEKTANTITDEDKLFSELREIQEKGVAFDYEEILPGLRCCAAPLTSYDGSFHGSISVAGPVSRMKEERLSEDISEAVLGAANVIQVNSTQV